MLTTGKGEDIGNTIVAEFFSGASILAFAVHHAVSATRCKDILAEVCDKYAPVLVARGRDNLSYLSFQLKSKKVQRSRLPTGAEATYDAVRGEFGRARL